MWIMVAGPYRANSEDKMVWKKNLETFTLALIYKKITVGYLLTSRKGLFLRYITVTLLSNTGNTVKAHKNVYSLCETISHMKNKGCRVHFSVGKEKTFAKWLLNILSRSLFI